MFQPVSKNKHIPHKTIKAPHSVLETALNLVTNLILNEYSAIRGRLFNQKKRKKNFQEHI